MGSKRLSIKLFKYCNQNFIAFNNALLTTKRLFIKSFSQKISAPSSIINSNISCKEAHTNDLRVYFLCHVGSGRDVLAAPNQDLWLQVCFICLPWVWHLGRCTAGKAYKRASIWGWNDLQAQELEWQVCQWRLQALTFFVTMAARANALGFFKFTGAFNRVWLSMGKSQGTSDTIHSDLDTCQSMTLSTWVFRLSLGKIASTSDVYIILLCCFSCTCFSSVTHSTQSAKRSVSGGERCLPA